MFQVSGYCESFSTLAEPIYSPTDSIEVSAICGQFGGHFFEVLIRISLIIYEMCILTPF